MKRNTTVSFSLTSKRKCGLLKDNSLTKKSSPLALFNDDEEECSQLPSQTLSSYAIEDTSSICKRLKTEGNFLAENLRYWEALSKFKKAIDLILSTTTIN